MFPPHKIILLLKRLPKYILANSEQGKKSQKNITEKVTIKDKWRILCCLSLFIASSSESYIEISIANWASKHEDLTLTLTFLQSGQRLLLFTPSKILNLNLLYVNFQYSVQSL